MNKVVSVTEAISLIKDGDTIATGGFVGNMHPEYITKSIEEKFNSCGEPRNLNLVFAAGQGDGKTRGLNHLGYEGLISKVIGGHWGLVPKVQKLALENKIQAYNLPQGVISQLYRAIAGKKPGILTKVGIETFVDPRLEGGKLNDITKEDIINVMNIAGEEYLFYKSFNVDIAIIRGTYADEEGNCVFTKECSSLEMLSMAQAAKNCGGKVILQVEKVIERGSLDYKQVKIPGIYVDAIVEAPEECHMQTFAEQYNPSYSQEIRIPINKIKPMNLDIRKIIARRASMELFPNAITNLGIGMPEGVSMVSNEEGIDGVVITTEAGTIGGVPAGGHSFGAALNADAIIDQPYQFDFYDGGGLDITFLGLAQCDKKGNVNVSKFGPKIAGCGGFINISQTAKKVVYCGTFTAGKSKIDVKDGKLIINEDSSIIKFIDDVEQVTFSGEYAYKVGQPVKYITERAVFELSDKGLTLTEIAPGIDVNEHILNKMKFKPHISETLKVMDERIFKEDKMGLKDII
ncbi:acyl CoA:acetate/3-ketoacid CoA transferase [Clostridium carnis]